MLMSHLHHIFPGYIFYAGGKRGDLWASYLDRHIQNVESISHRDTSLWEVACLFDLTSPAILFFAMMKGYTRHVH